MKRLAAWICVTTFSVGMIGSMAWVIIDEWPQSLLILGLAALFAGFIWGSRYLLSGNP